VSTLNTVTSNQDSTQTVCISKADLEKRENGILFPHIYEETKSVCMERFWQKQALQLPAKD